MLNKKGFTLIEMLLVFSIILTTSLITLKLHIPVMDEDDYVQQVSNFLYEAKMNAIVSKEKTKIILNDGCLEYSSKSKNKKLDLSDYINSSSYEFSYNAYGNIYKAKTVNLVIEGEEYHLVFQVGSGCFEVR